MKEILYLMALLGMGLSLPYFVIKGCIPYLIYRGMSVKEKVDSIRNMLIGLVVFGASAMILYVYVPLLQ